MLISLMKAKIHRATVTQADLNYQGSISIDFELMKKVGIREFEQVDVVNINNGERFTTYAIKAESNSGEIKINGAAARKAQVGDLVIIIAYGLIEEKEAENFMPKIAILNEKNRLNP